MISFENVAKVYDAKSRPALDAVTLDIARGEFVFLVGASGSGKSTLLQLVLREQRPTRGKVLVAGKDVAKLASWKVPHLRRQMGAVFQDFRLLPNKTVHENVAFALQVIGRSRSHIRQTVPEVLEMVGLADKHRRMPHELSGGEQQRVAIARAIANRPVLLLADEPTGNLDPTTSLGIMRVLDRIQRGGTTVVMATHDDVFVNAMRKRVIELSEGRVVRDEDFGEYTTTHIPVVRLTPPEEQIVDEIAEEETLVDARAQARSHGAGVGETDAPQATRPPGDSAEGWVPQAPAGAGVEPENTAARDPAEAVAAVGASDDEGEPTGPDTDPGTVHPRPALPAGGAVPADVEPTEPAGTASFDHLAALAAEQGPKLRASDTANLARHLSDRLRRSTEAADGQATRSGDDPDRPADQDPAEQPDQAEQPPEPETAERIRSRRAERANRAQRSGLFRRR